MSLWQFLIAAAIAVGFIQLAALSVWVAVLSLAIQAILAVVLAVAMYFGGMFVWRRYNDTQGK